MPASSYPSSSGHRYHLYGVDCGAPSSFSNMSIDRYTEISTVSSGTICNCDHYHYPNNNDGDLRQLDGNEILRISTTAAVTSNGSSHQISSSSRSGSTDNVSYLPYDKQRRPNVEGCSRCGSDTALMDSDRKRKKGNRKIQDRQQHYRGLHHQYRNERKEAMQTRRLLAIMGVFVAYISAGAAIFNAIEAKPEQDRKQELKVFIENFLGEC
ncbi:hypothetical protein ElyMa_005972300 [Elysia marginata]|uniref:Potassium channel domain-containing protein n=1 Tax=Elysia marginata TaxID=1093978 RepID=A0AAV4GDI5_9GAST|nr:hypothetical protein ElyMa_005972300 [Elysia marginata]